MTLGAIVWLGLGACLAAWIGLTQVMHDRVPKLGTIVHGFLDSALGRAILLAGWAEVGWHLFCQHP